MKKTLPAVSESTRFSAILRGIRKAKARADEGSDRCCCCCCCCCCSKEALKSFGHRQSKGSMGSLGETWPPLDLEETKVNEAPRASTDRSLVFINHHDPVRLSVNMGNYF